MATEARGSEVARTVGLWLGILAFFAPILFPIDPGNGPANRMAGVVLLMAIWWVTDCIPLFATALVPLVLFPLLGILSGRATAPIYFNSVIVLFIGGFMIALTMEKWNLHRRIALAIIDRVGGGPGRVVLGFMLAAAFLSMWISNTATAVMMVPIGLAMIYHLEEGFGRERAHTFAVGLMLGIAYSCSVGGLMTLVGTPPNLALVQIFQIIFPEAPPLAFGQWMILGVPLGLVMLFSTWALITKVLYRVPSELRVDPQVVKDERSTLGPVTFEEKVILAVFGVTALLWIFRVDLQIGLATIPGWSRLLPNPDLIDDGTVAITMASVLFFIPTKDRSGGDRRVMGPDVIPRLPWNIVLLFGGGFALAEGFQATGLAQVLGERFAAISALPTFALILLVCLSITFLTELTSNTATTQMILPILADIGVATGTHPLVLMIPATLSASCAFMMPVATPPNAIIFGSGRLSVGEMARAGLVLNLVGAIVISVLVFTLGTAVFDIDPSVLPEWAIAASSTISN
jgi:sodium-dependent dicarboxylate transporter 2/3/5